MKILVTGANGFIGSYLCNYLLENGHDVIGISRKYYPDIKKKLHKAQLIEADVLNDEFSKLEIDADAIIHLASANDILSKNTLKGIELSSIGTINTLRLAHNNGIEKFIFYSTLQVYGSELEGIYNEETQLKPENDYAMNHLFGEMYAEMFSRKTKIKIVVVRPSNIYGSFLSNEIDRWTLVPGCFCKEAIEKGTITLMSSGMQKRNFISLEQLSYASLKTLENSHKKFDILNLVSNDYRTISEAAFLVSKVLKEKFNINISPTIKSNLPSESNSFYFDTSNSESYKIDNNHLQNQFNLESEISKILDRIIQKSIQP